MANTLAQYGNLSQDTLQKGILDTIIKESPLLRRLPWIEIVGNALLYNLESTLSGGAWVTVGDTITEATPTWEQRSMGLSELIGDADVDKFVEQTRSNVQDIQAAIIEKKAKGLAHDFDAAAICGRTTALALYSGTKVPKGLLRLIAECESSATVDLDGLVNTQVVAGNAASDALTIDMMDTLRDRVKPKPDAFMMSRRMRRKLQSLARASGNNLQVGNDALGNVITRYGEEEVLINDFIGPQVEDNFLDGSSSVLTIASYAPATTRASGYDNSIIFALRFGEDGVCGLHNGAMPIIEDVGTVETKDAKRTRLKMYVALNVFSTRSVAALINVLDTALS